MHPVKIISKNKFGLLIKWSDNSETEIPSKLLRRKCPCATCLAERERQGTKYIPLYSNQEITIKKISIVGNYAITISWNDGHNTGIYEFSYLLQLASSNENLLKT